MTRTVGKLTVSAPNAAGWRFTLEPSAAAEEGVEEVSIVVTADDVLPPPRFDIAFDLPQLDAHHRWSSELDTVKLPPNWYCGLSSRLCSGFPVVSFVNDTDENRILVAVSEARQNVGIEAGLREEDCHLVWKLSFFAEPEAPRKSYAVRLRIDRRSVFFAKAIREAFDWIEHSAGLTPAATSEGAFDPVYSAWYSFHQNVNDGALEAECAVASALGMKTLIVDDGWQTDDNNRGYAFTGDWKLSARRFPDMAAHVKRVHALGMRYMMWYGVPMIGFKSGNYDRFKGKYLWQDGGQWAQYACLDPRFPEVREFLCGIYETAVREWDIDGLKLDFVDAMSFRGDDPAVREDYAGRDIKSLSAAVDCLLKDVSERIRSLKPDFLFEFRQGYVGPAIRQYGNMMRASDCPGDLLANRCRTVNLRLSSGRTAVHSDMLEWNRGESPEQAARFILSVLFSTIQYSMMLRDLPSEHKRMLNHWIGFTKAHRDTLLKGEFRPHHFEANYPWVEAVSERERIVAVYTAGTVAELGSVDRTTYAVNGTGTPELIVRTGRPVGIEIFDTCGSPCGSSVLDAGVTVVKMPVSGYFKTVDKKGCKR